MIHQWNDSFVVWKNSFVRWKGLVTGQAVGDYEFSTTVTAHNYNLASAAGGK